ncbi:4-hydroxyphenylacetate 3-hydroxylase family protein [Luteipulveratus mongoliensis]|uniref:4-hydroxyphenylacetate 3-monooxygenase n=1 Tax=Luteipulveratus mongoliensis TaxID=571913 RepID=A0A0K1JDN5_9MICO|nr:4-hydroxyphenylacetate 3-hydroxylase N-terminal domain-containing protein [Luteipulveratus mongoliensis]AKU14819.1 4-hydroxyphenylacetate 3-monooxygenase [Luteipulveratus mongoliensis]
MTRNGQEYLEALQDGRTVWLGRERVDDVTTHPAFAQAARSFARLYDLTNDPEHRDDLTVSSPSGRTLRAYDVPKSYDDLVAKREAHRVWAADSFGFLGRSPDYMAAGAAGFLARPQVFTTDTYDGADNVRALHQRWSRDSIFPAFTITNPASDRSKTLGEQEVPDLFLSVDQERDDGIVVSGSKMIGTAAVFADEIMVGTIEPLGPDDQDFAFSFALSPSTPGVSLISRMSYEAQAASGKDYPLSSRFDENDALLVCESVFVPWERVLTYRNVESTFGMWWQTPAYTYMAHQASTRFWTKMEFLAGVAVLVTRANGSAENPAVRSEVGRLLGYVQMAKSMVLASEAALDAQPEDGGAVRPDAAITYAQRILAGEIYPKFVHQIKMFSGGSLTQVPASWHDLHDATVGPLLKTYARSVTQDTEDRVALMKLAWDAVGSEFASRHAHYEQFYQGAPHVYLTQMAFAGGADECADLAGRALSEAAGIDSPKT